MYEVIILATEYMSYTTQKLDHPNNQCFEFATLDEATAFSEICWENCKDTVIRKSDLGRFSIYGGDQGDAQ